MAKRTKKLSPKALPLNKTEAQIEADIDDAEGIKLEGQALPDADADAAKPKYKVYNEAKVVVSKAHGKTWKYRKDQAASAAKDRDTLIQECFRYYDNDQSEHRQLREGESGNATLAKSVNDRWSETENIVYANINAQIPIIYNKNPSCEITVRPEDKRQLAELVEEVVNVLSDEPYAPGLASKAKVRRAVLYALLTNCAFMEVGWTTRADSDEQLRKDLADCATAYAKAETQKEIEEIEGKLKAIEERIDIARPAGPWQRVRSADQVLVDPASESDDLSDANWIMICDYVPTSYLKAKYAEKNNEDVPDAGLWKSIYRPTHVIRANEQHGSAHEDQTFTLFNEQDDMKQYGYSDRGAYVRAQYTKVWYVWDKVTRTVSMYNEQDWEWPIWVWPDPLRLQGFFPVFPLLLRCTLFGLNSTKGEAAYYMDQQDAINDINSEMNRARLWARKHIIFDKESGLQQSDVEALISGPDVTAKAVTLGEGKKISDVIGSVPVPSLNYRELFDKSDKYTAVDRIGGANALMRGEQFKTNTTKYAVQQYQGSTNVVVDDKIDAIEDWFGKVCWAIAQLCLMNYSAEEVSTIVGHDVSNVWVQMDPRSIRDTFVSLTIVGGSTLKPTSATKKEEALKMGQVLGQFASAAPGPVVMMLLKIFEKTFDDFTISRDDWKQLRSDILSFNQAQQMPRSGSPGDGAGGTPKRNEGGGQPSPDEALRMIIGGRNG